jgi:hypothetical protein
MDYFYYFIAGCALIVFLYFGYKDDYNRDKNGFMRIVITLPLVLLLAILYFYLKDAFKLDANSVFYGAYSVLLVQALFPKIAEFLNKKFPK